MKQVVAMVEKPGSSSELMSGDVGEKAVQGRRRS